MTPRNSRLWTAIAAAIFLIAASAGAECPATAAARLTSAGYTKEQKDTLCASVAAVSNRGIVVSVRGDLLDQFTRAIFPLTVSAGGSAVTFTEGRYCGAAGPHSANLLAAAIQASDGTPAAGRPLTASDCTASLQSVAQSFSNDGNTVVVARMRLSWSPWRLTTSIVDAASQDPAAAGWPERRRQLISGSLPGASMTAIRLPLTNGHTQSFSLSAIVYCFDDSIAIAMAPEKDLAAVHAQADIPSLRATIGLRLANAPGNGSILLSHGAVNDYAHDVLYQAPFPVGTNLPLFDKVDVREFSVRGAQDMYDLSGVLTDADGETYHGRISLRGSDLALSDLAIESDPHDCDANDFSCQLLQEGKKLLTQEVTKAARRRLEQRAGRAWLDYIEARSFRLPWIGTSVDLTAKVDRTSSDDEALILHARFSLERVAP